MVRQSSSPSFKFFERFTKTPGSALIAQSGILATPPGSSLNVFDNACGMGIMASLLHESESLKSSRLDVLCGDLSPPMVEETRTLASEKKWNNTRFEIIDAQVEKTSFPPFLSSAFDEMFFFSCLRTRSFLRIASRTSSRTLLLCNYLTPSLLLKVEPGFFFFVVFLYSLERLSLTLAQNGSGSSNRPVRWPSRRGTI
jgi:SAM-dependent methyltransferase